MCKFPPIRWRCTRSAYLAAMACLQFAVAADAEIDASKAPRWPLAFCRSRKWMNNSKQSPSFNLHRPRISNFAPMAQFGARKRV
uniref:Putative secreted protein n=1 Tax=Anopheles marajoara TaxID=58244 RepID=A0A2M4CB00_9DIPT